MLFCQSLQDTRTGKLADADMDEDVTAPSESVFGDTSLLKTQRLDILCWRCFNQKKLWYSYPYSVGLFRLGFSGALHWSVCWTYSRPRSAKCLPGSCTALLLQCTGSSFHGNNALLDPACDCNNTWNHIMPLDDQNTDSNICVCWSLANQKSAPESLKQDR